MLGDAPCDPLDDLIYLRSESSRLRRLSETFSDPLLTKELAAHSFYLAQRAEAVSRIQQDRAIRRVNTKQSCSKSDPQAAKADMLTIEDPQRLSAGTLDSPPALRELAAWYRSFAERAGNPVIWEARLRTAEDLEAEAESVESRSRRS